LPYGLGFEAGGSPGRESRLVHENLGPYSIDLDSGQTGLYTGLYEGRR